MTVPHFTKGYPLLASDLNALADAACANIIGGAGCAVKRIGKRVIVEKRVGQIVPKGGYATIWKMTPDLEVAWGYDTGGVRAYGVVADDDGHIYATCDRETVFVGQEYNLHAITDNGSARWRNYVETPGSGFVIGPNDIGIGSTGDAYVGSYSSYFTDTTEDIILRRYDAVDGSVVSSFAYVEASVTNYSFKSPSVYGGYVWGNHSVYSPTKSLFKIAEDLSSYTLSSFVPPSDYWATRVAPFANGVYVVGYHDIFNDYTAAKFNLSAVHQWSKVLNASFYGSALDVVEYGTDSYWLGSRNQYWDGATGYANFWKLNSGGTITSAVDIDSIPTFRSCCIIGTSIFASGNRHTSSLTSSGYASLWEIDLSGAILNAYDFGVDDLGNDVVPYYVRANSTHLFVATTRKRR